MKKTFYYFSLLLLFITGSAFAQEATIPQGFYYTRSQMDFNLPQFDFCLPLPSGAGFCLPLIVGEGVAFEQNEEAYYYFDQSYLWQDSFAFKYTLSSRNEHDCLWMYIVPGNRERVKQEIAYEITKKASGVTYEALPSLEAALGECLHYKVSKANTPAYYIYILSLDDFSYLFRLNAKTEPSQKAEYEAIIRQAQEKTSAYRRARYETRVANGDFSFKGTEQVQELKISDNHGVIFRPFTFEWNNLGFSFPVPQGFEYQVSGEINYQAINHIKIRSKGGLEPVAGYLNSFKNKDLSFNVQSYKKESSLAEEFLRSNAEGAVYSKEVEIVVDGLSFPATYYGSTELGSLSFVFSAQEYQHLVIFEGVSNKTLPLIEKILSGMKLHVPKPTFGKLNVRRLSTLLNLDDWQMPELDPPFAQYRPLPAKLFEANLIDLGIRLYLPGKGSDYKYYVGTKIEGSVHSGVVKGRPADDALNRLSIYRVSGLSNVTYHVVKRVEKLPIVQYTQMLKRTFSAYKNIDLLYAGINRMNGIDWSVLFYKSGGYYTGLLTAYKGNYEIQIAINYEGNEQEALRQAAFIQTVWFKILPDFWDY